MTADSVENMIFDPPALQAGALAALLSVRPLFITSCCFVSLSGMTQVDPLPRPVTARPVTATPAPTQATPIPADPLEALRAPYLRNITVIRARRDARAATIIRSYVATVERLQREAATRGDLDAAMQMKAEGERVNGGQDPTPTERRAMPTALNAARSRYEAEREPFFAESRQQEAEQTRGYLAALD